MKTDVISWGLRGSCGWGQWALLAALVMVLGCGGGGGAADPIEGMTDDQKAVEMLVGSVSDMSGDLKRLRGLYTSDAAPSPADAKKIGGNMFAVDGDITVTGSTASCSVTVTPIGVDGGGSEQTWKATKEGDAWKLSEAPLP